MATTLAAKNARPPRRREKKARRKERGRTEAAGRAAADEVRQRGACITLWRSCVVTACGGGGVARVEALLDDHPFGEDCAAAETARHMEWLLPACLSKCRGALPAPANERAAQLRLAAYVLDRAEGCVTAPGRNGLEVVHDAAWMGYLLRRPL